jgi:hypothetical protein
MRPSRICPDGPDLGVCSVCCRYPVVGLESKEPHTGIRLYASSDLTRANLIKKGNILAKDGLEVALANTLSGHLGGIDPSTHVNARANKHTHACKWGEG